jgi:YHS domain-containing protein
VETGWRLGNHVEIVKGLKAGERIVISGNFLIDSESKLEMAASGMQGTLIKDPVCGQEISPIKAEKAGRKIAYGGKTYYFDTDECNQQFEKDPKRYAAKPAEGDLPAPQAPSPKAPKKTHGHDHS